jgi:hypothetical protein
MHHYCDTGTSPSQCHTLEHDTDALSPIPRHWRPHFSYISGLLYLHSSTSGSAVSHGYYKQIRPIVDNPDWDQDQDQDQDCSLPHCLAQPSAINGHLPRYWSFSHIPGTVSGQLCLTLLLDVLSWRVGWLFCVGWSLYGLARASTARKKCRTPGAQLFSLSLSSINTLTLLM